MLKGDFHIIYRTFFAFRIYQDVLFFLFYANLKLSKFLLYLTKNVFR